MKVAIVGSRDYPRLDLVRDYVAGLAADDVVISGGARGVDRAAEQYAAARGLTVISFPALWNTYGRSAGFKRNAEIVMNADRVVAFWDGRSRGTLDTICKALEAGKPVQIL